MAQQGSSSRAICEFDEQPPGADDLQHAHKSTYVNLGDPVSGQKKLVAVSIEKGNSEDSQEVRLRRRYRRSE